MKAFMVIAVIVGAAFGAPSENIGEIQRIKKSYGSAPFAGSAAPVALYLSTGPGGIPHYRDDELAHEDKDDHVVKARSYYGGPASAASAAAAAIAAAGAAVAAPVAPAGPAVGIFPGAKVGGCAVPLLLSCAPSVHSGHIAHSAYPAGPAYPAAAIAAPAYRTEAEHVPKMREMTPAKTWSETEHVAKMHETVPLKNWAASERAAEMREDGVQRSWDEMEHVSQMRENAPMKGWAELERSTQMLENAPMQGWSARAQELTPMKAEAHHHHHHHNAGDLDSIHHV